MMLAAPPGAGARGRSPGQEPGGTSPDVPGGREGGGRIVPEGLASQW